MNNATIFSMHILGPMLFVLGIVLMCFAAWPGLAPAISAVRNWRRLPAKPAAETVMRAEAETPPAPAPEAAPEPDLSAFRGVEQLPESERASIIRTMRALPEGHREVVGALLGGFMSGAIAVSAGTLNGKAVAVLCGVPEMTGATPGSKLVAIKQVPIAILATANLADDLALEQRDDGSTPAALGLPPVFATRSPFLTDDEGCGDPECTNCNPVAAAKAGLVH